MLSMIRKFGFIGMVSGCVFTLPISQARATSYPPMDPYAVSAGEDSACAIVGALNSVTSLTENKVICWGNGQEGQLGNGSNADSHEPVFVTGIVTASKLSVGHRHACAILGSNSEFGGSVKCWGLNDQGQLGDGTNRGSSVPVTVVGITNAIAISSGYLSSCAIVRIVNKKTGAVTTPVKCWGWNSSGQLGNGTVNDSATPVTVSGINNASAIGASSHSCATLTTRRVKCWGLNNNGQLGNNSFADSHVPVQVSGITNAILVSAAHGVSCAKLSGGQGGQIKCWGYNNSGNPGSGNLGNGSNVAYSPVPVFVTGIANGLDVSVGFGSVCSNLFFGSGIKCWGDNYFGELGNGTTNPSNTPVLVSGISDSHSVGAGSNFSCAATADEKIMCWGINTDGQLGDGTISDSSVPVTVNGF